MDDGSRIIIGLSITVIVLLIKGFIAVCESAVIEVNDTRLKKLAERDKSAAKLIELLSKPNKLLTSLTIFKAMASVIITMAATIVFYPYLSDIIQNQTINQRIASILSAAIIAFCITILINTFGYSIPKKIAQKYSMDFAIKTSGVLKLITIIFTPLSRLSLLFSHIIGSILGVSSKTDNQAVTEEEILMMVDAVNETGAIEESQKEMINNIFQFDDLLVSDVMTHRTEISAVEKSTPIDELVKFAISEGFSRIPVYENGIDNINGVVYIKDLLILINSGDTSNKSITDFMREIKYVPETNHCGELFKEFSSTKSHIAVAVDEYGGTAGIVTMEDLLEAIVGNIQDEYDNEIDEIVKNDDETYEITGNADPEDVFRQLGLQLPDGHYYDTMGGLIIDILGHIPAEGELVTIEYNGVEFSVLETEEKRISKLKATIVNKNTADE